MSVPFIVIEPVHVPPVGPQAERPVSGSSTLPKFWVTVWLPVPVKVLPNMSSPPTPVVTVVDESCTIADLLLSGLVYNPLTLVMVDVFQYGHPNMSVPSVLEVISLTYTYVLPLNWTVEVLVHVVTVV